MNKVIRQGEILQINGENIYPSADTVVYWNSINENNRAEITTPPSTASVAVRVPADLPDTNKVVVCNRVGCYTGTQEYDYVGFPEVTSISHLSRDWGKQIILKGNHLKDVTGVRFDDPMGGAHQALFDLPSKKQLNFYMPNDFTYGHINLFSRVGSFTSSQMITGVVPPIEGELVTDGVNYYGDKITAKGRALHKVNRIRLEGLNENIYVNDGQITNLGSTGLYFNLPEGVKDESYVYLQNQFGQYSNGVYNSTVHEEFGVYPLDVSSPYIKSLDKAYGKYDENILISGINLGRSKILFLDYNNKYSESTEVNSGQHHKTVKVPKNIRSNRALASGNQTPCSGLAFSPSEFYPLPTIQSTSSNSWVVGSTITIDAVNAFNIFKVVAITGSNLTKSGANEIGYAANDQHSSDESYHLGIISLDNSSMLSDASAGGTVISAVINADFIGEGHPFLISKDQIQNETTIPQLNSNINLYNIKATLPSVTGQRVTISGKKPNVISLSVNKASASGDLSVSGKYFLGATGIELSGQGEASRLSPDYFAGYARNNRGVFVLATGLALSDYEQMHYINLNLSDFNFTKKSGEFKVLTPYHE